MKKLLIIGLLLGSQLSFAAQEPHRMQVNKTETKFTYIFGISMVMVGFVAVASLEKTFQEDPDGYSMSSLTKTVGTVLLTSGGMVLGHVLTKDYEAQRKPKMISSMLSKKDL